MTIEDILKKYQPKPEFSIWTKKSEHTGNYTATVWRKDVIVNRFKGELTDTAVGNISTSNINEFLTFLKPYLNERIPQPS